MKNVVKGQATKIVLEQPNIPNNKVVFLTILDEAGNPLRASNNTLLESISLTYNNGFFETPNLTIHPETPDQYIRLYFLSPNHTIEEQYYPQDARLISISLTGKNELVPLQYFTDYVLNANTNLDSNFRKALQGYINSNREGIRKYLQSAEHILETNTKLYFMERTIPEEKRDFFFDRFTLHFWQFIVSNPPINELVKFEIVYGNNPIAEIDTKLFITDRLAGIIEFLPIPSGEGAGLYSLLMSNLSGLALAVIQGNNLERIPALFRATYKTGLIYKGCDEKEKESIRMAVCKQALIEILPKVDPALRVGSTSESIDGVSKSKSYQMKEIIKEYQEQLKVFAHDLRVKYGRNVEMVIV